MDRTLRHGRHPWLPPRIAILNPPCSSTPTGRLWLFWPTIIANYLGILHHQLPRLKELQSTMAHRNGIGRASSCSSPRISSAQFSTPLDQPLENAAKPAPDDSPRRRPEPSGIANWPAIKLPQPSLGWAAPLQAYRAPIRPDSPAALFRYLFPAGLMAISDDHGATWFASRPLVGFRQHSSQPFLAPRRWNNSLPTCAKKRPALHHIRVSPNQKTMA